MLFSCLVKSDFLRSLEHNSIKLSTLLNKSWFYHLKYWELENIENINSVSNKHNNGIQVAWRSFTRHKSHKHSHFSHGSPHEYIVHRLYKAYKIEKKSVKPAARTLNKHNNDTAVCYSRHFRNRMHVLIIIRSTRQSKQISSNKTYGAMLTQLPQIEATS